MYYSTTTGLTDPTNLWYAVQTYCETTEPSFVNNIPTFITIAEKRIYNSVQLPVVRKTTQLSVYKDNKYVTLPTDWLSSFSLALINPSGEYTYLLDKDVNFIRESFPTPASTGTPQYSAIFDESALLLGPTPSRSFKLELNYYAYPTSITVEDSTTHQGTSWLGTNFEYVLLYGVIREAYTYLKGDTDLAAMYEQKYQEALGQLKVLGDGKDRRDAYRSGQVRVPVT
mgnify:CR=1 FL=1